MKRLVPALAVLFAACGAESIQPIEQPEVPAALEEAPIVAEVAPPPAIVAPKPQELIPLPSKDPYKPTTPLKTPAGEWTWVDLPESKCANGSPTGIGVNLAETPSDEVLVFLQGGGACWDGTSCYGINSAFYVGAGYGRVEFATDIMKPALLPLRKDDENNPFRHMNIIYVPYCTGDVHMGDALREYEFMGQKKLTFHHGFKNVGLALDKVQATFPNVKRIWLAGDSAGGFGSALNLDRTQRRFPTAWVDVLDDSGQPIEPVAGRWKMWVEAWNLQLPEDCPECGEGVAGFVAYYMKKYPDNRFALISWTNDSVITAFMGLSPTTFYNELFALKALVDESWPSARYYLLPGALHVGLATPTPGMIAWLKELVEGGEARSVSPW